MKSATCTLMPVIVMNVSTQVRVKLMMMIQIFPIPFVLLHLLLIYLQPQQSLDCFMFTNDGFPPPKFENNGDKTIHAHKILNPTAKNADDTTKSISSIEATLNWKSENVLSQNKVLQRIEAFQAMLNKMVTFLEQLIVDLQ
ncbi:hypothetical protein U1Q18_030220 [Sarracenia purpurea var. burkii]